MAAATASLTENAYPAGRDNTQRCDIIIGVCALSGGGTYVTNGVPLTWTVTGANGGAVGLSTNTGKPLRAFFYTTASSLYAYWWDRVHNTLRISLAGVELANNAAITADTIEFHSEWSRSL